MSWTSEPISALLHESSSPSERSRICQTSQLMRSQPPLHSMRSLRSSLSVLCGTAPCVSLVCFRVASICPISTSRRFALQRLCLAFWFLVLWSVSCTRVAPVFSAGFLYSLCFLVVDHGELIVGRALLSAFGVLHDIKV